MAQKRGSKGKPMVKKVIGEDGKGVVLAKEEVKEEGVEIQDTQDTPEEAGSGPDTPTNEVESEEVVSEEIQEPEVEEEGEKIGDEGQAPIVDNTSEVEESVPEPGKGELKESKAQYIAEFCHELIQAYHGKSVAWEDVSKREKENILEFVARHLDNPELTAEESHNKWFNERSHKGWSYGAIRMDEKKEHPRMLMYNDLPKEERAKDRVLLCAIKHFNT